MVGWGAKEVELWPGDGREEEKVMGRGRRSERGRGGSDGDGWWMMVEDG